MLAQISVNKLIKWDILNYNQLSKTISLSSDGTKFQFSSGGLFQLSFGLFQNPKQTVEILLNNKIIAKSKQGTLTMIKRGNRNFKDFEENFENNPLSSNKLFLGNSQEKQVQNNRKNEMGKFLGLTFQDYLIVEFGSWIGVRLVGNKGIESSEAFIRILKI